MGSLSRVFVGLFGCAVWLFATTAVANDVKPIFASIPVATLPEKVKTSDLVHEGKYKPFVDGRTYFTVDISKMNLPYSSAFWKTYYPAAKMRIAFRSSVDNVDFETITPPSKFIELTEKEPERIATFNKRILAPSSYAGGPVKFEVALVGLESSDIGKVFLDTLANASNTFGVKFLSEALPIAETLKSSVESFMGLDDVKFEVGVDTTFNAPHACLWVMVWPGKKVLDTNKFSIIMTEDEHIDLLYDRKSLSDVSWAIIKLGVVEEHPNWKDLPGLLEAQKRVFSTLIEKGEDRAREALTDFQRVVLNADDLQWLHRLSIYNATKAELNARVTALASLIQPDTNNLGTGLELFGGGSAGDITTDTIPSLKATLGVSKWINIPNESVLNVGQAVAWEQGLEAMKN